MSSLMAWGGELLSRNGDLAGHVDCCCNSPSCACCGSINDVTLTVAAAGCSLDEFSSKITPVAADDWTFPLNSPDTNDCVDAGVLDVAAFYLTCVDGNYQLHLFVSTTDATPDINCYAEACVTWRTCVSADGFLMVFTMECCGCDLVITCEEDKPVGP